MSRIALVRIRSVPGTIFGSNREYQAVHTTCMIWLEWPSNQSERKTMKRRLPEDVDQILTLAMQ